MLPAAPTATKPIAASSAGSCAEQRRERHAVHVAAGRRLGRVHVAVRVDPDQAERQRRGPAHPGGAGRHRSGGQAVIAAEHERQRAGVERLQRDCRRASGRPWRCRGCTSCACRPGASSRESAPAGLPLSTTVRPSAAMLIADAGDARTPTAPCRRRAARRRGRAARR